MENLQFHYCIGMAEEELDEHQQTLRLRRAEYLSFPSAVHPDSHLELENLMSVKAGRARS